MNEWNLFSSFSLKGAFWSPANPAKQVKGVISFNPTDGPILELLGSFHFGSEDFKHPILYGEAQGKRCTLYKCYRTGATGHLGSHGMETYETYKAIHLFVGEHFNPDEEVLGALQVSFTKIEEWFFHRAFSLAKNADESVSQTAVFKQYPIPVVTVGPIDAVVDFDYNTVISDPGFREMRWTTELFIQVTPREKQKIFEYYRGHIKNLQYLMTLLTGLPTFPRAIHFKWDDSSGPIQMFYADRNAKEKDKTDFTQMMTLFPRIKEHWSSILSNWFASAEKLHSSMVLLFETMFKPTNVEMDFLRYAQALESFHRAQGGAFYMPTTDYKTKVYDLVTKAIPSDLDDSLKASLRSRLKYGNEYSLRKRLQELITSLPPEVLALVKFKQIDEKIGEIVDNRNYLTHYSDELAEKKSEPLELWELGKALEVILVYYLFRGTGIPWSILQERFIQKYHTWFNQPS